MLHPAKKAQNTSFKNFFDLKRCRLRIKSSTKNHGLKETFMNNVVKSLFLALCIASIASPITAITRDESIADFTLRLFLLFKPAVPYTQETYTARLIRALEDDFAATLQSRQAVIDAGLTSQIKGVTTVSINGRMLPLGKCWGEMTNTKNALNDLLKNKTANYKTPHLILTGSIREIAGCACDGMRAAFDPAIHEEDIDLYAKLAETAISCIEQTYSPARR